MALSRAIASAGSRFAGLACGHTWLLLLKPKWVVRIVGVKTFHVQDNRTHSTGHKTRCHWWKPRDDLERSVPLCAGTAKSVILRGPRRVGSDAGTARGAWQLRNPSWIQTRVNRFVWNVVENPSQACPAPLRASVRAHTHTHSHTHNFFTKDVLLLGRWCVSATVCSARLGLSGRPSRY